MKPKILITLILLLAFSQINWAQKAFDDDIDDENSEAETAPIDSGIAWLLGAAAAYGIKKHRDQKETLALRKEQNKRS